MSSVVVVQDHILKKSSLHERRFPCSSLKDFALDLSATLHSFSLHWISFSMRFFVSVLFTSEACEPVDHYFVSLIFAVNCLKPWSPDGPEVNPNDSWASYFSDSAIFPLIIIICTT